MHRVRQPQLRRRARPRSGAQRRHHCLRRWEEEPARPLVVREDDAGSPVGGRKYASFRMGNYLIGKGAASSDIQAKQVHKREKTPIKFEDLPEGIQCTILSKLSLKELIRTSVLSSEWRYMWANCPRLCFDGAQLSGRKRCMKKFIDNVNAVLQKCNGHVVEELMVKFGFESILADHLDNWIRFAVSSRTKVLAFDLEPIIGSWLRDDRYIFPLQLLNNGSISCLQNIQLSFVYLKLPSQFGGFPNLRKLDLTMLRVTRKDLEDMLSSCRKIEWLRLDRCHLNDELQVDTPLSHLLHLNIVSCKFTKIAFNAVNLKTFEYDGYFQPIILNHSRELDIVSISFYKAVFQHALTALLDGLPSMKCLNLDITFLQIEMQGLNNNLYKFSRLRNLQLFMNIEEAHADKIICLVSFLRATPLIEILEVHFDLSHVWLADVGPTRQKLWQCEYNHLKSMNITGYQGARGQLEFILHVVENAPALEVLAVDTTRDMSKHADLIAKCCLSQKYSPTFKFRVV